MSTQWISYNKHKPYIMHLKLHEVKETPHTEKRDTAFEGTLIKGPNPNTK